MYQTDKRRRIHYENYTNQKWGSRENYDLCSTAEIWVLISVWNYYVKLLNDGSIVSAALNRTVYGRTARLNDGPSFLVGDYP